MELILMFTADNQRRQDIFIKIFFMLASLNLGIVMLVKVHLHMND